jgi:hypothetical protein
MTEAVSSSCFTDKLSLELRWSRSREGQVFAGDRERIRAEARTGLYSLALPEPPVIDCRNAAGGVSARAGNDPFRERQR